MRAVHRNCSHYRKQPVSLKISAIFVATSLFVMAGIGSNYINHVKSVEASFVENLVTATASASTTPLLTPTPTVAPSEEEQIVTYIKTIFGKEWKTACAIARAESGLRKNANNTSKIEKSIGIFQINLENETTKVHFHRVPGKNLEEKIEWLENPFNNTLMAYWIYTKSHFNPWSVYIYDRYQVKLEDCK